MRKILKRKSIYSLIVSLMLTFLDSVPIYATEGGTEAVGSVILPTVSEEIISVVLPTVGDVSPFDFFIDPQGLIYETDAAKYGGGRVEEGANLLFHNHERDDYDFSRYSDDLTVTNKSTVPVIVRITAKITDVGDLRIDQDGSFDEGESPAIYLVLVDDEGNERPLSEDGEVVIEIEMNRAPSGAYTYRYNEEQNTYGYVGLRGECNADADWTNISVSPRVTVTWEVEPVLPENEEENNASTENVTEENTEEDAGESQEIDPSEETETTGDKDESASEGTLSSEETSTDVTGENDPSTDQDAQETVEKVEDYTKSSQNEQTETQDNSSEDADTGTQDPTVNE